MQRPTPPASAARHTKPRGRHPTGPAQSRLGRVAERLLATLARGPVPHAGDAGEVLLAHDLAVRRSDGALALSDAGRSHLARLELSRNGAIDPFLGQHLDLVRGELNTDHGRARVMVDAAESPLAWLARRKARDGQALISSEQLLAGERLRDDFTRAQLTPRITANWMSSVAADRRSGGDLTYSDAVVAARQRMRHALDAVGPEFTGLLLDVCCFLKGLEDVERERRWPARSGKVVLQLGLGRLARHYGYGGQAQGAGARGGAHVAGAGRLVHARRVSQDGCASAALASARMRSTMERKPLERCGVRCSRSPSRSNSSTASVARMSRACLPE
jgi:hypothetical protein